MGFKIESISSMTTIANNLSTVSTEATAKLTQTSTALDELVSNVKGSGIDTTLNSLKSGVNDIGNKAVTLLNDVPSMVGALPLNTTEFKFKQDSNAQAPMLVTLSGIVISVMFQQAWNV